MKRNRLLYAVLAAVVIALGLASRRYGKVLPPFLAQYAGDTLWAMMAYLGIGWLFPRWSSMRVALAALATSFAIEISQLYHAPWLDDLRHTRLGGLVLGIGFLWSDLVCYTTGVAAAVATEVGIRRTIIP